MFQQVIDFRQESLALYALMEGLSDDEFHTQTQFKQWTINDIIGHLHMWNWAADLSLRDESGILAFLQDVQKSMRQHGDLKPFENQWLDGLSGRTLLHRWQGFFVEMSDRFSAADPRARVKWGGPDMSVRSSISARLMETWAHGQAAFDVLGRVREDTDRIRNVAVLGVNTYGWTFANRGREVPGPMPHVQLTAPGGEIWTWGEPDDNNRIEGSATGFCQTVTQVRNVADTDLDVRGATAAQWMTDAQCFAGPPQDPPPPGTRFVQNQ